MLSTEANIIEETFTNAEVWNLVIENEALLKREARKMLSRSRHARDFDDMYADVVYGRAHSIMATYRPGLGAAPLTHLCVAVRWYCYKWSQKRTMVTDTDAKFDQDSDPPEHQTYREEHFHLTVEAILDKIPEDMAKLLRWSVIKGYTVKEIADFLEVPQRQVRADLIEALELAQDYAGVEHSE